MDVQKKKKKSPAFSLILTEWVQCITITCDYRKFNIWTYKNRIKKDKKPRDKKQMLNTFPLNRVIFSPSSGRIEFFLETIKYLKAGN